MSATASAMHDGTQALDGGSRTLSPAREIF